MRMNTSLALKSLGISCGLAAGLGALSGAQAAKQPSVTLALDCVPLTQVATELTRQSGTVHRIGGTEGARQRVVVFCKDQPASAVRTALTRLLGWTWSRRVVEGRPVYTLVKGALLERRQAALRERFWQAYQGYVERLVAMAEDPSRRPPNDGSPVSFQVHDPQHVGVLRSLGALPQPAAAEVLSGKPFVARGNALPPGFRSAVGGLLDTYARGGGREVTVEPTDTVRFEVARDATGRPLSLQFSLWRGGKLDLQFNSAPAAIGALEERERDPARETSGAG
jgi:hypothetical protein